MLVTKYILNLPNMHPECYLQVEHTSPVSDSCPNEPNVPPPNTRPKPHYIMRIDEYNELMGWSFIAG